MLFGNAYIKRPVGKRAGQRRRLVTPRPDQRQVGEDQQRQAQRRRAGDRLPADPDAAGPRGHLRVTPTTAG